MANNNNIDRSLIKWTDQFEGKTYTEIFQMLLTNYQAIYGADIDLNANSADGEKMRMEARIYSDFVKLAQEIYYSLDYNNAKGQLLDIILGFSGNMKRRYKSKTVFKGIVNWSSSLDLGVEYSLNNDMISFILVRDSLGLLWEFEPKDVIEGSVNSIEGTFTCSQYGDYLFNGAPAEIIIDGATKVFGGLTLTNTIITNKGSLDETDAMFRARKKETLAYNSFNLADSIKTDIMDNILSVDDVWIYSNSKGENVTIALNKEDSIPVAPHNVLIIIKPVHDILELDEDTLYNIALLIQRKLTLGISTQPNNSLVNYEVITLPSLQDIASSEYDEDYWFYISQPYSPSIKVDIEYFIDTPSQTIIDNIEDRMNVALYNLSKTYKIGQRLNKAQIMNTLNSVNEDISNPIFNVTDITIGDIPTDNDPELDYWAHKLNSNLFV
mgnify:CR=1 FL=1